MKKIVFTLFATLSLSAIVIAQPTLTSANFTPVLGDNQLYYAADTNSLINNTTGANVTFNYTDLRTYGITQTQYYIDPTTTTYTSDFPSATYADSTNGFAINKNYTEVVSTDSLMNVGFVANNTAQGTIIVKYTTDQEKIMEFPFDYGDFYIDAYSGIFSVQGVQTNGNGQATVNADAWGTLQLPLGISIDSVLRVKTIEYLITDTIFLQPLFPNILPIIVNAEYVHYYKPSISKFPLLSFASGSYTQNGSVLDSSTNVVTQYPMPTVGIDELNGNNINLSLYPNPSGNDFSTLSFDLENNSHVNVALLNNLGQNIQTVFNGNLQKGTSKITIRTSNLSSGLYFVLLNVNNKMTTKKLLIK